jgi:hypothetical protein
VRQLRIGIVVLMTTSWPRIRKNTAAVAAAIPRVQFGGFIEVRFEAR